MALPRKDRFPHRRTAVAALAATALAVSSGVALGAAGDPDPGFDGDGRAVLPFKVYPSDVLVQRDGKIVVTDTESFLVLRLNPDGSPDRSWGGDGAVAVDFGSYGIGSAALQPDGKLVVAGYAVKGDIAVARLNENGALDGTFDPGGPDGDGKKLYTDLAPRSVAGVLIQRDGKIVIAGDAIGGLAVSRVTSTGAPDGTTFDLADFPDAEETPQAAALADDGSILVAGYTTHDGDDDIAVARFTAAGKLDTTLASTGMLTFGTSVDDSASAVLVQPDGKLVVGGDSGGSEASMIVARRKHDGSPDTAFGTGGTAVPDFVGVDTFAGLALQGDGKLLVAGTTQPEYLFAAARLDAGGTLDPSFGSGGRTTIRFADRVFASAAGLQGDGGFVIAGALAVEGGVSHTAALARVLGDPPPASGDPGVGGAPPSVPRCAGRPATIVGTAGRDTLRGTRRADVIVGLGGNDRIAASRGDDIVCGGPGNDRIAGGPGADRLTGDHGRDVLKGGPGRDRLTGGPQRDRCLGGAARDRASTCELKRAL